MKYTLRKALKQALIIAGITLTPLMAHANVVRWGANMHPMTNTTYYPLSALAAQFAAMQARGLKHIRVDVPLQDWNSSSVVTNFTTIVNTANTYGITVEAVLMPPFDTGDRTDGGKYPAGDRAALYQQGYNRVMGFVPYFRNTVTDYELANEVNLRNLVNGSALWGKGTTAAEFDTTLMGDWAAVLKGMSDAITDINKQYGTQLRRVVGTTSSMFGYIDYMKSQGVVVDVIGYHYYERINTNPNAAWLATGETFNLFTKMASYNTPIHVNEINCGETYDTGYTPIPGNTLYGNCLLGLNATLGYFSNQTSANIENIDAYELIDERNMTTPENLFGLYYVLGQPRSQLYILEKYAGGPLTALEKATLTARGIPTP